MQHLSRRPFFLLAVLSATQVIGWGTTNLPAVIGEQFARDLGLSLPAAFAGTTAMLVVMGFTGPLIANLFVRYGARLVMAAGTLIAVPGFLLLAVANGPLLYYAAWAVLGIAGAAMLNTASYILLNEVAGHGARRLIGGLMISTALSASLFWPLTAALSDALGWRMTAAIYGATMLLVSFPLHFFCLPAKLVTSIKPERRQATTSSSGKTNHQPFVLLMCAITLNGFVTWGFASTVIQLLKTLGTGDDWAIRLGSMVGLFQICARGLDLYGGARWDGLTTALVGGLMLPLGFAAVLFGGSANWAILSFIVLYGLASGAMAIARATMPLAFYDQADFARAASHISLPLNLAVAVAPPILVGILTSSGANALLLFSLAIALIALAMVFALLRRQRTLAFERG